jgi:hypothetical protein
VQPLLRPPHRERLNCPQVRLPLTQRKLVGRLALGPVAGANLQPLLQPLLEPSLSLSQLLGGGQIAAHAGGSEGLSPRR